MNSDRAAVHPVREQVNQSASQFHQHPVNRYSARGGAPRPRERERSYGAWGLTRSSLGSTCALAKCLPFQRLQRPSRKGTEFGLRMSGLESCFHIHQICDAEQIHFPL